MVFVARSGGSIQRYVVYRIIHDEERSAMSVADYLFRPGRERDLRSMLVHIVQRGLCARVASFDGSAFSHDVGFPVIGFQNELGRVLVARKLRWYFTIADTDNV